MNWSQAPLSMGFPWQEYWNGLPFPTLGDLPDPGIQPASHISSTGRQILYPWATWEAPSEQDGVANLKTGMHVRFPAGIPAQVHPSASISHRASALSSLVSPRSSTSAPVPPQIWSPILSSYLLLLLLAAPNVLWDPSSLTKGWTLGFGSKSAES